MFRLLLLTILLQFVPLSPVRQALESGWISTCDAMGCYGRAGGCRERAVTQPDGTRTITMCYYPFGF